MNTLDAAIESIEGYTPDHCEEQIRIIRRKIDCLRKRGQQVASLMRSKDVLRSRVSELEDQLATINSTIGEPVPEIETGTSTGNEDWVDEVDCDGDLEVEGISPPPKPTQHELALEDFIKAMGESGLNLHIESEGGCLLVFSGGEDTFTINISVPDNSLDSLQKDVEWMLKTRDSLGWPSTAMRIADTVAKLKGWSA